MLSYLRKKKEEEEEEEEEVVWVVWANGGAVCPVSWLYFFVASSLIAKGVLD